jgi:hypothetical protein
MKKVRSFEAEVEYRDQQGMRCEERFPVRAVEFEAARDLALGYVLRILKLSDFELRLVGS